MNSTTGVQCNISDVVVYKMIIENMKNQGIIITSDNGIGGIGISLLHGLII